MKDIKNILQWKTTGRRNPSSLKKKLHFIFLYFSHYNLWCPKNECCSFLEKCYLKKPKAALSSQVFRSRFSSSALEDKTLPFSSWLCNIPMKMHRVFCWAKCQRRVHDDVHPVPLLPTGVSRLCQTGFFFLVDQILYMFWENQDYHFCFTSAAPPDGDKWQNEMLDTGCEGLLPHTKKEQC